MVEAVAQKTVEVVSRGTRALLIRFLIWFEPTRIVPGQAWQRRRDGAVLTVTKVTRHKRRQLDVHYDLRTEPPLQGTVTCAEFFWRTSHDPLPDESAARPFSRR